MNWKIKNFTDFEDGQTTIRGEKVWVSLSITLNFSDGRQLHKLLKTDSGITITEEFIEDTISGCLKALESDFPFEEYRVLRQQPNVLVFEYAGPRGMVN